MGSSKDDRGEKAFRRWIIIPKRQRKKYRSFYLHNSKNYRIFVAKLGIINIKP